MYVFHMFDTHVILSAKLNYNGALIIHHGSLINSARRALVSYVCCGKRERLSSGGEAKSLEREIVYTRELLCVCDFGVSWLLLFSLFHQTYAQPPYDRVYCPVNINRHVLY